MSLSRVFLTLGRVRGPQVHRVWTYFIFIYLLACLDVFHVYLFGLCLDVFNIYLFIHSSRSSREQEKCTFSS